MGEERGEMVARRGSKTRGWLETPSNDTSRDLLAAVDVSEVVESQGTLVDLEPEI